MMRVQSLYTHMLQTLLEVVFLEWVWGAEKTPSDRVLGALGIQV